MKRHLHSAVVTCAVVLSSSAAAFGQAATGPYKTGSASAGASTSASTGTSTSPSTSPSTGTSTGTSSAATAPAAPPVARAAGERSGVGVGAEVTTTGVVGATVVYDGGPWRGEALFGTNFENTRRDIDLFGRFFFVLHRATAADFSIGPGIGLVNSTRYGQGPNNTDEKRTDIHIEAAVQIRAFLVSNVALSAAAGLGLVIAGSGNTDSAVIGGSSANGAGAQAGGAFGITYFFY